MTARIFNKGEISCFKSMLAPEIDVEKQITLWYWWQTTDFVTENLSSNVMVKFLAPKVRETLEFRNEVPS